MSGASASRAVSLGSLPIGVKQKGFTIGFTASRLDAQKLKGISVEKKQASVLVRWEIKH